MRNKQNLSSLPETSVIENVYKDLYYRKRFLDAVRSTVFMLIVVAAFSVLVSMLFLPILRIYGKSMKGTLNSGEVVMAVKTNKLHIGDVVAFYYNNNILVKRVIATSGDWVDIDHDGNVYVNEKKIKEAPHVKKAYGKTNIKLPYQVPEDRIFVMGDNRKVSIDSRNKSVGTVATDQIVGRLSLKVWPLSKIGTVQ